MWVSYTQLYGVFFNRDVTSLAGEMGTVGQSTALEHNSLPPAAGALHKKLDTDRFVSRSNDASSATSPDAKQLPQPQPVEFAASLPGGIFACLFDLDGVLTQTAKVHAAAWKQMFDAYLLDRSTRAGEPFHPGSFDTMVCGHS
jgi:hypothetical protein